MKVLRKLIRINYYKFILIFFTISLLIASYDYILPGYLSENSAVNEFKEYPIIAYLLLTTVLIPFIETVIFQGFVIHAIRLRTKKKGWLCLSIGLSAFLFGVAHCYNTFYIFFGVIIGIVFAFAYYLSIYRKESPILTVTLIHGLVNLAAFFDKLYF